MDEERLDLSALDPARDPDRWQGVVNRTLARVDALLEERGDAGAWDVLAAWSRSALPAAAVLAAILLAATAVVRDTAEATVDEPAHTLAVTSTRWATGAGAFSTTELLASLEPEPGP